MTLILRAEWQKLRTVPDLAVLMALTVALTISVSWVSSAVAVPGEGDPVRIALLGVQVGQAVAAIAGVQMVAGEFGTGMIGATLLALPRRGRMLAAKALLLSASTVVAAVIGVLSSLAIARSLLSIPIDGSVARAVTLSILQLLLIALLGLGVGALARNAVAAVGVVLGLLYLMPILLPMFLNPDVQRVLFRLSPGTAVQALQSTTADLPLRPWPALGVIALWTAAALLLGAASLTRRDA
jgi:ABC-2 type transport system permease protein